MTIRQEDLVEIWKTLELLTVSLKRLGWYEVDHGKSAAVQALDEFFGPPVLQ